MEILAAPIARSFGTATTSIGGYAYPPRIWRLLAEHDTVQVVALTILVWQSGHVGAFIAFCIAIIFYATILLVRYFDDELVSAYVYITGTHVDRFEPKFYTPRYTD